MKHTYTRYKMILFSSKYNDDFKLQKIAIRLTGRQINFTLRPRSNYREISYFDKDS